MIFRVILAALGERLKNERALEPRGFHARHGRLELHTRPEHLEPGLPMKIITAHTHGHGGASLTTCRVNVLDVRRLCGGGKH